MFVCKFEKTSLCCHVDVDGFATMEFPEDNFEDGEAKFIGQLAEHGEDRAQVRTSS